jgi:hypothetical protein
MRFVGLFLSFGPAVIAQVRGHSAALKIIALNFLADGVFIYCLFHSEQDNDVLGVVMMIAWLGSFFWSIKR